MKILLRLEAFVKIFAITVFVIYYNYRSYGITTNFQKIFGNLLTAVSKECRIDKLRMRIVLAFFPLDIVGSQKEGILMKKLSVFLSVVAFLTLVSVCRGQANEDDIWRRDTLTNGFSGHGDQLAESGLEIGIGLTNVYQANVKGGTSTNSRRGRFTGSYDIEMTADLQKLFGFETGNINMLVEAGWPDAEGIDELSVGSVFGINADAIGNDGIYVKELFYEGTLFSDNLTLAFGKIDFTGIFDCSAYADDECGQFLNAALVDNLSIAFPDVGLAIVLTWNPTDSSYIMAGISDAQANGRETGFKTTFHDEDYFFLCS